MFTQHFREKVPPLEWGKRLLILILAAAAFYLGVRLLVHMGGQLSTRQKRALSRMEEKKRILAEKMDVTVVRAGFERKPTSAEALFMPSVVVRVHNLSDQNIDFVGVHGSFSMRGRRLCPGSASIPGIGPHEFREVVIRCIESSPFGAVIHGIRHRQLKEEVTFRIDCRAEQVSFLEVDGVLDASPWLESEGEPPGLARPPFFR